MKREIVCESCADGWSSLRGKFPGEEIGLVAGELLQSCRCDGCGKILHKGHLAIAVSVSTHQRPYTPWEHHYLEIANESNRRPAGPDVHPGTGGASA